MSSTAWSAVITTLLIAAELAAVDTEAFETEIKGGGRQAEKFVGPASAGGPAVGVLQSGQQIVLLLPISAFFPDDAAPTASAAGGAAVWVIGAVLLWQVKAELAVGYGDHGALDHVFLLADITWPVLALQAADVGDADRQLGSVRADAGAADET